MEIAVGACEVEFYPTRLSGHQQPPPEAAGAPRCGRAPVCVTHTRRGASRLRPSSAVTSEAATSTRVQICSVWFSEARNAE